MKKIYLIALVILTALALTANLTFAGTKKVVIETPNPCIKVEKVEGKKVYLKSSKEPCIQVTGKEVIEVGSAVKSVFVYIDDRAWGEQEVKEFSLESVSSIKKTAEEYSRVLKIPENINAGEARQKADESAKVYYSEEFQKKIQAETERIKKEVFGSSLSSIENYYKDKKKEIQDSRFKIQNQGKSSASERIYVFISSSIPLETIRTYVKDISGLGDGNIIFVMRGFIDGMKYIKPTIGFIEKAVLKDKNCDLKKDNCEANNANFVVDPLLFRRYGIVKVPAFVYVPQIEVMDAERSEGVDDNAKAPDFHVIYGDASFEYILEALQRETKSRSIDSLLTALREGFYK